MTLPTNFSFKCFFKVFVQLIHRRRYKVYLENDNNDFTSFQIHLLTWSTSLDTQSVKNKQKTKFIDVSILIYNFSAYKKGKKRRTFSSRDLNQRSEKKLKLMEAEKKLIVLISCSFTFHMVKAA